MTTYETVTYEQEGGIAIISMNRPESRNSLNAKMREELLAAIQRADMDQDARVVVLRGEGKGFCAGADLADETEGSDQDGFVTRQVRNEFNPLITAIIRSEKPIIAAVNAAAAGIGAAIVMACDLVVMDEYAFLYSAFGAISLIPDGGSHYFYRSFLGPKKAFELIAFSQRIQADECLELGIANKVVSESELMNETLAWAKKLTEQAPLTMKLSKQLLREAQTADIYQIMDREAVMQNTTYMSEDFKEGTTAFFEKRKPNFKGK